jgi:hypothetical protein
MRYSGDGSKMTSTWSGILNSRGFNRLIAETSRHLAELLRSLIRVMVTIAFVQKAVG